MMILQTCPLLSTSVSANPIPQKKALAKHPHRKERVTSLQVLIILDQMILQARVLLEQRSTTTTTLTDPHSILALYLRQGNIVVPLALECLQLVKHRALAMPRVADHRQLQVRMLEATLSTLARSRQTSMFQIFIALEHKVNLIGSKKQTTITRIDTTQPLGMVDMMMRQGEANQYLIEEAKRHHQLAQTTSTHHMDLPARVHTLGLALATTIVAACMADHQA
jgi:hypothetical protein